MKTAPIDPPESKDGFKETIFLEVEPLAFHQYDLEQLDKVVTNLAAHFQEEVRKAYDKGFKDGRFAPTRIKEMSTEEFKEYRKLAKRRERAKQLGTPKEGES